jgi:hypothetical protein
MQRFDDTGVDAGKKVSTGEKWERAVVKEGHSAMAEGYAEKESHSTMEEVCAEREEKQKRADAFDPKESKKILHEQYTCKREEKTRKEYRLCTQYVREINGMNLYNTDAGFDDVLGSPDATFELNDVAQAIEQLEPQHYRLFLIMFVTGYSCNDIANRFDLHKETVRLTLFKARNKLQVQLCGQYRLSKFTKQYVDNCITAGY